MIYTVKHLPLGPCVGTQSPLCLKILETLEEGNQALRVRCPPYSSPGSLLLAPLRYGGGEGGGQVHVPAATSSPCFVHDRQYSFKTKAVCRDSRYTEMLQTGHLCFRSLEEGPMGSENRHSDTPLQCQHSGSKEEEPRTRGQPDLRREILSQKVESDWVGEREGNQANRS